MVMRASQAGGADGVADAPQPARYGSRCERVLYVVSMFPCWSETFIVREIMAMLRRGADVRIVSLRRSHEAFMQSDAAALMDRVLYPQPWYRAAGALLQRLLRSPITTARHPVMIVLRLWRDPVVMLKSLVAWFRSIGLFGRVADFAPGHVHAHWATYSSTAAMALADHLGCRFSFTAHAHDIFIADQLMAEKLESAAFVVTISRFNREYLRRRHRAARDARIEVIHCGVPHRGGLPQRCLRRRPEEPRRLLCVARLDEIKGLPTLLDACCRLRDDGVNFRCEIIGDGPLRERLRARLARDGLVRHVTLAGARPSQEVERKLAAADVFVLASQQAASGNMDGIPVALMEAMAAGTPVVSTAVSGIPELVVNERTGLLVPPGNPESLARAIRRMLDDEPLRERCIEQAWRKVRNEFDADTEGGRLLGVIRSLSGELHAQEIADHNG